MGGIYGVGLIGVAPPASWSVVAHLPALRARADKYRIAGIANSSAESSRAAAETCGVKAFDSVDALCASPEVDLVVVAVRADRHAPLVEKALAAGKHVFCEWPLGRDLDETRRLADLAAGHDRVAVCGSQAVVHPTLRHAAALIADGFVGDPLFVSVIGVGGGWGPAVPQRHAYGTEESTGASLITIPIGHTLVGLQILFGPVAAITAECSTRRRETRVIETGELLPVNSPDSAIVAVTFASGLPMSMHYRGGINRSGGFRCEIIGTSGELLIAGTPFGAIEMVELTLAGARAGEPAMVDLPVPAELLPSPRQGIIADNVMTLYDRLYDDLETGSRSAPSFADAAYHHRLLDAISRSSAEGRRIEV